MAATPYATAPLSSSAAGIRNGRNITASPEAQPRIPPILASLPEWILHATKVRRMRVLLVSAFDFLSGMLEQELEVVRVKRLGLDPFICNFPKAVPPRFSTTLLCWGDPPPRGAEHSRQDPEQ